jgi:hypothetical protein
MTENKKFDVKSKIKVIKLLDFSFTPNLDDQKFNSTEFSYNYEVNVKQDSLINQLSVTSKILIFSNKEQDVLLGKIDTYGEFEIINMKEISELFNGNLPSTLLALCTGVLLSTTRGMLILKSENTILQGAIMPLMDPNIFFTPEALKPPNDGQTNPVSKK